MVPEQAIRHYQGEAGQRYHGEKRALPEEGYLWVARLRAEKLTRYVGAEDVVLEYGVGAGWNLAALQCKRKIGYDVSNFLEPNLQERGIEFTPETAVLPDASMDVVLCHHTLEHVQSPATALTEMRRLLREGGKLLLFVPFEYETRYAHFDRDDPNHHLYSWNAQTLGSLVQESGFTVDEAGIGEFGYSRFAANWAARLRMGERGFRLLRRLAHLVRPGKEVRVVGIKKS